MIIANSLGIFLFLFLVWRRLKEDYTPDKIFNLCFSSLLGFVIGFIISKNIFPYFWFWIEASSIVLAAVLSVKRQKLKFFESLEGLTIGFLPWLSLFFLAEAIRFSSLSSFLAFWTVLICIFFFFFISSHYRSFTWYKSGKVGFSSIVTLLLFFLMRFVVAFFFPDMISLVGSLEKYLSGAFSLVLFLVLLNLNKDD